MRWFRRRDSDQDARLTEARAAAEDAAGEVERSRRRQESVREHVVKPLRQFSEHNQFADLLRATLVDGHEGDV